MAYKAACLALLSGELDNRFGGPSRPNDGWVGDTSHQARKSDHNPVPPPNGVVRALDIYTSGIGGDGMWLVALLITDSRTNYVIHKGSIWSRTRGFARARYDGANPHNTHVHVSIRHGSAYENDLRPWLTGTATGGDDMPLNDADKNWIATTFLSMLKSEGVSGGGDVGRTAAGVAPVVWSTTVRRTNENGEFQNVKALQELADAKSAALANGAKLDALAAAVASLDEIDEEALAADIASRVNATSTVDAQDVADQLQVTVKPTPEPVPPTGA